MPRSTVGVFPADDLKRRRRLFSTLSRLFEVEFAGRRPAEGAGLDGAIVFDDRGLARELAAAGVRTIALRGVDHDHHRPRSPIRFAPDSWVDARLRGRALDEGGAGSVRPLADEGGMSVLASGSTGPVWAAHKELPAPLQESASGPDELADGEPLKARLEAGRFLSLVPLVHFLRSLDQPGWSFPPVRASFIFDDVNLHWPSYGYLRCRQLAAHAADKGYRAAIALIPIDAWFAHRAAVACFAHDSPLSLLVHGCNHTKEELSQAMTADEALGVAAQAVRRIAGFEAKSGLAVSRLMSPPHGSVSETMMAALLRTGFEAICYWGPSAPADQSTVGWNPADVDMGGGLPGLHRVSLDASVDELALRAFLGQPLLLSGHHTDLARGLDVLADAAERVEGLGPVRWMSPEALARSTLLARTEGSLLRIMSFARRVRLDVPAGVDRVRMEWPAPGARVGPMTLEVEPGTTVEIAFPNETVDPRAVDRAGWRPWPVLRRCLTEGRDRVLPLVRPPRTAASDV
jgi:hypothetical protein